MTGNAQIKHDLTAELEEIVNTSSSGFLKHYKASDIAHTWISLASTKHPCDRDRIHQDLLSCLRMEGVRDETTSLCTDAVLSAIESLRASVHA